MPLIIEDGTGVVGANSYITVDQLRTYALDRGVSFAAAPTLGVDPAIAVYTPLLIIACDYINSLDLQFSGLAWFVGQALSFPRNPYDGVTVVPSIPTKVQQAQAQLVLEQLNGVALFPSQAGYGESYIPTGPNGAIGIADGRFKIVDKLDVIESRYSEKVGADLLPIMPAVEALLRPLMINQGRFFMGIRV